MIDNNLGHLKMRCFYMTSFPLEYLDNDSDHLSPTSYLYSESTALDLDLTSKLEQVFPSNR